MSKLISLVLALPIDIVLRIMVVWSSFFASEDVIKVVIWPLVYWSLLLTCDNLDFNGLCCRLDRVSLLMFRFHNFTILAHAVGHKKDDEESEKQDDHDEEDLRRSFLFLCRYHSLLDDFRNESSALNVNDFLGR